MRERCYGGASIFFSFLEMGLFLFYCLSQTFRHFKVTLFVDIMPTRRKFMVKNSSKKVFITFNFDRMCRSFSGLSEIFETHCKDWAFVSTTQP